MPQLRMILVFAILVVGCRPTDSDGDAATSSTTVPTPENTETNHWLVASTEPLINWYAAPGDSQPQGQLPRAGFLAILAEDEAWLHVTPVGEIFGVKANSGWVNASEGVRLPTRVQLNDTVDRFEVRSGPRTIAEVIYSLRDDMPAIASEGHGDFALLDSTPPGFIPWHVLQVGDRSLAHVYAASLPWDDESLPMMDRVNRFLGQDVTDYAETYIATLEKVDTAQDFSLARQMADFVIDAARDPLNGRYYNVLTDEVNWTPETQDEAIGWLTEALPGIAVITQPEFQMVQLYMDLAFWQDLAAASESDTDDRLLKVLAKAFWQGDPRALSVAWLDNPEEDVYCSKLGEGIHLDILKDIAALEGDAPMFQPILEDLRNRLMLSLSQGPTFYTSYCNTTLQQARAEVEQVLAEVPLHENQVANLEKALRTIYALPRDQQDDA